MKANKLSAVVVGCVLGAFVGMYAQPAAATWNWKWGRIQFNTAQSSETGGLLEDMEIDNSDNAHVLIQAYDTSNWNWILEEGSATLNYAASLPYTSGGSLSQISGSSTYKKEAIDPLQTALGQSQLAIDPTGSKELALQSFLRGFQDSSSGNDMWIGHVRMFYKSGGSWSQVHIGQQIPQLLTGSACTVPAANDEQYQTPVDNMCTTGATLDYQYCFAQTASAATYQDVVPAYLACSYLGNNKFGVAIGVTTLGCDSSGSLSKYHKCYVFYLQVDTSTSSPTLNSAKCLFAHTSNTDDEPVTALNMASVQGAVIVAIKTTTWDKTTNPWTPIPHLYFHRLLSGTWDSATYPSATSGSIALATDGTSTLHFAEYNQYNTIPNVLAGTLSFGTAQSTGPLATNQLGGLVIADVQKRLDATTLTTVSNQPVVTYSDANDNNCANEGYVLAPVDQPYQSCTVNANHWCEPPNSAMQHNCTTGEDCDGGNGWQCHTRVWGLTPRTCAWHDSQNNVTRLVTLMWQCNSSGTFVPTVSIQPFN